MKNKGLKEAKNPSMNILGLDTSSRMLTVACSAAQGAVSEANFHGELQHSENFFHLMESVLASHCVVPKDQSALEQVDAYAIGMGPGSFTGLRIGFSVLKGLLAVHRRPVYGISSLDLIADGISLDSGRLVVAVNARRERIYAAFYRFFKGRWEREAPEDEVLSPEDLTVRLGDEICVAGDALREYGDLIQKKAPKAVFIQENFWYPRAGRLVNFVRSRYTQMKPLDAGALQPRYLRLSEAEEKKLGNLYSPTGQLS